MTLIKMSFLKKSESIENAGRVGVDTRKSTNNQVGRKLIGLFTNTSKNLNKRIESHSDTTSNESSEKSSTSTNATSCFFIQQKLSGSMSQSKLMIIAQDDGGIYKGPNMWFCAYCANLKMMPFLITLITWIFTYFVIFCALIFFNS